MLSCNIAFAKHLHHEDYYQKLDCYNKGGIVEYKLQDKTRIDCLLEDEAIEYDFANKWYECIGQALYYSMKTQRQGVCILIVEKQDDNKYVDKAIQTIEYWRINIKIKTIQ